MATSRKNQMRELMVMAWALVKKNGFSMAEAMKQAWLVFKTKQAMLKGIVKFYFTKVNGEIREAYGTLKESVLPATKGERKQYAGTQVYFDSEKQEYRCFKVANLLRMA